MENNFCRQCAHYRQHYAFDQRKIFRVYCGHCMLQQVRKRKPDAIACGDFTPGPSDEDAFATKEYLSKEILQYLLNLDLLPQIEDGAEIKWK